MYLTPSQRDDLHNWLAEGVPYGLLRHRMLNTWGDAVTSAAVSQHRKRYAADIARRREVADREAQRREHDRQRKAAARSGMRLVPSTPPSARHCPTCRCLTGPGAA